jgi:DMSO/TMAO reductase YedYZ molybdopterin-dependent catalytic subunit
MHDQDPFRPHAHDPNMEPPSADPLFTLIWPAGSVVLTPDNLKELPLTRIDDCYVVSTGHGVSGPFSFGGVTLRELIDAYANIYWVEVLILSQDGFGTRLTFEEVRASPDRPIILAYEINGVAMSREKGLVRLIVPSETDDALRQVKWVGEIRLLV